MPGEVSLLPSGSPPVEASFVVIDGGSYLNQNGPNDNDNNGLNDNDNNGLNGDGSIPPSDDNGNVVAASATTTGAAMAASTTNFNHSNINHVSPSYVAPLSISRGPEIVADRRLPTRSNTVNQSHPTMSTMSIDQIRSSLMLHASEIKPEHFVENLVRLYGENRKFRHSVRQLSENLERASKIIVKLRAEKENLEEAEDRNFARAKKKLEKMVADAEEKTKALAAAEKEVKELTKFRVEAASWQQQCETAEKKIKEQDDELKSLRRKWKEVERQEQQQQKTVSARASVSSSISSEPSTPSSNEFYLDMVAKVSDLEQEKMSLETRLGEATATAAEMELKAAESESRLRELTTREKQSEHDLLGLRDTIAAHKLEINTLRKEKEELARINQDLQEDVNVKDLMDVAQMEISASTKNWAKMASTREDTPKPSLVYDSRVENIEDEEAAMAEERRRFAAAMEKWKAQEAELEAALTGMRAEMATIQLEKQKEVDQRVEQRLKSELAKELAAMTTASTVQRSESHPPLTPNINNSETTALKQQVISLVDELKQSQMSLQRSKETEQKTAQKYEMFKTEREMEDRQTTAQITMMRKDLEDQDAQLKREKEEANQTQRDLAAARKELMEKDSLIHFFNSRPASGAGRGQNLAAAQHENGKLKLEIDRLTAVRLSDEDAINAKDAELSKARQENAKLRSKLDDNAMLHAAVQVYKEDFNQERQIREQMAQEKEQVLRDNQQLQDQISVLNDLLQQQAESRVGRNPIQQQQQPRLALNGGSIGGGLLQQQHPGQPQQQPQYPGAGYGLAASPNTRHNVTAGQPSPAAHQRQAPHQNLQQQQLQFQRPQQQQQQPQSGIGSHYPLADREAASMIGRHPRRQNSPSLSCPFQGVNDVSPGAFAGASNFNVAAPTGNGLFCAGGGGGSSPGPFSPSGNSSPFSGGNNSFLQAVADGPSPSGRTSPKPKVVVAPESSNADRGKLEESASAVTVRRIDLSPNRSQFAASSSPSSSALWTSGATPTLVSKAPGSSGNNNKATGAALKESAPSSPSGTAAAPAYDGAAATASVSPAHDGAATANAATSPLRSTAPSRGALQRRPKEEEQEEEDWQLLYGTCPKCQLKVYDLEMLQMHVIECLDTEEPEYV